MKIGILGGTRFIGFHAVEALLKEGADVSIFHRGRTREPRPFSGRVRRFLGDRDRPSDLDSFFERRYDAVIDLSGYTPRQVEPIVEKHRARVGHYLFCSTALVYQAPPPDRFDEGAARTLVPGTYGGDKALVEDMILGRASEDRWPATIFRPQGVFGPHHASQALYVFQRVEAEEPVAIRPEASGRRTNLLWIDDLVRCFLRSIGNPRAIGQAFNVAGSDVCTPESFIGRAARAAGAKKADSFVVDGRLSARLPDLGLPWHAGDLVADAEKISLALDVAMTPLDEALGRTWAWARAEPGLLRLRRNRWEREAREGRLPSRWNEFSWRLYDGVRSAVFARSFR